MIKLFPPMDHSLLLNGLQLLFQTELILDCGATVSIFTYFAPVVRSWWKKGLFVSKYKDDSVGRAVTQKRLKVHHTYTTYLI